MKSADLPTSSDPISVWRFRARRIDRVSVDEIADVQALLRTHRAHAVSGTGHPEFHVDEGLWIFGQYRCIGSGDKYCSCFFRGPRGIGVLFVVAIRIVEGFVSVSRDLIEEWHDAEVVAVRLGIDPAVGKGQVEAVPAHTLDVASRSELDMGEGVGMGDVAVRGARLLQRVDRHVNGLIADGVMWMV